MSLDTNLFTLNVTPNQNDRNVTDLVDPSGIIHYRKQRVPGPTYKSELYDPMSGSLLVTVTAPSATSKTKIVELCNPTITVELKYTGTLSFRWSFKWEEHEFEWKREECFMLRKPDPPVLVAVTKEPPGRIKTTAIQILDYNLNRFDIDDRKGLEIVILAALLSFQDSSDVHHGSRDEGSPTSSILPALGTRRESDGAPIPPPRPAPRMGLDRVAEIQAMRREVNEVAVEDECAVNDYAQYCANLLQDEAMLFITVRSSAAIHVPKVLQVVEETKRIRHRAGLADDEELHQYVLYDSTPNEPTPKGPKRINLNDGSNANKAKGESKYAPPTSLTVHLSKIPMPELQPRSNATSVANARPSSSGSVSKDDKKEKAAREAEEKRLKKEEKKGKRSGPTAGPSYTHSNQIYPHQPSPSPSQLNNPGIYSAPPPRPPQNPYSHPAAQPGPPPPNAAASFYGPGTVSYVPRPPPAGGNLNIPSMGGPPTPSSPNPGQGSGTQPPSSATAVVSGIFGKVSRWAAQ